MCPASIMHNSKAVWALRNATSHPVGISLAHAQWLSLRGLCSPPYPYEGPPMGERCKSCQVSVVIPLFNSVGTLQRAINSSPAAKSAGLRTADR